jgi:hypothetical protein
MTDGAGVRAGATLALAIVLAAGTARAQFGGGQPDGGASPDAAPAGADGGPQAAAQAASVAQAAQELEAQVVELNRRLDALNRQRQAFEDVRRRLDELEARLGERRDRFPGDPDDDRGEDYRDRSVVKFRDDGFFIRSPNRVFQLRPRVRLQSIYTAEVADAGPADQIGGIVSYPDRSNFALAHAEVILEGHAVARAFEFRLQVDGAEPRAVKDAFVRWRISHSSALRVGQMKVPFSLQRQVWSAELEFIDRSAATNAFSLERDVGLMFEGRPFAGRLRYEAAVLNGSGAGVANDNLDMAYAARVVAAPFGPLPTYEGDLADQPYPLVSGGLAGYYSLLPTDVAARTGNPTANLDVNRDGRIDNVAVWQGGIELRAIWRGAALQAELYSRAEDSGAASPLRKFWGGYAQASYFVLPQRLQLGARLGRAELPLYGADVATREARGTRLDEQSAVVTAYLRGHRAKLQVDYTHLSAADATRSPDVHRVRAAIQLAF